MPTSVKNRVSQQLVLISTNVYCLLVTVKTLFRFATIPMVVSFVPVIPVFLVLQSPMNLQHVIILMNVTRLQIYAEKIKSALILMEVSTALVELVLKVQLVSTDQEGFQIYLFGIVLCFIPIHEL